MATVHHPEKDYDQIEAVGARLVPFKKGRATVTEPGVLRHYRRAGYRITDDGGRRPNDAGTIDPTPTEVVDSLPEVVEHVDPLEPAGRFGGEGEAE